jgi:hypothetical protein
MRGIMGVVSGQWSVRRRIEGRRTDAGEESFDSRCSLRMSILCRMLTTGIYTKAAESAEFTETGAEEGSAWRYRAR